MIFKYLPSIQPYIKYSENKKSCYGCSPLAIVLFLISTYLIRFLFLQGKERHYELGQWLRKRYSGFLNDQYNVDEIYVRSTDVDRTLMSAESNLAGLYPPVKRWNADINWQPIPVHTVPQSEDALLSSHAECPRLMVLILFNYANLLIPINLLMFNSKEKDFCRGYLCLFVNTIYTRLFLPTSMNFIMRPSFIYSSENLHICIKIIHPLCQNQIHMS